MRTLALLGLLAASTTALAGAEDFVGSVDNVVLAGTVSVPLVADPNSETLDAMVTVRVGEDTERSYPVQLGGREAVIVVPQSLVDEYELDKKSKKDKLAGTIDYVDIDVLHIGELRLEGVRAMVQGSGTGGTIPSDEVRIGMGALPTVSYAILPSQGVVKFAPAAEGPALLSEVGGAPLAYSETPWGKAKFGKDKVLVPFRTLELPAKVGEVEVKMALEHGVHGSAISPEAGVALEGGINDGDAWYYWLDAGLGEAETSGWFYRNSSLDRGSYTHQGVLGSDAVGTLDIAVDRSSMTLAVAPVAEPKRESIVDSIIERAEKDLEEGLAELDEAGSEEGGEESSDDSSGEEGEAAPDPARSGLHATLAGVYSQFNRVEDAVASYATAVELDGTSCTLLMSYGEAQLLSGDVDGAIASLGEASELYHAWWDHSLEERKEMKRLAKKGDALTKDAEGNNADPKEAPGACHTADGLLAAAHLVKGDLEAVEQAYRAHLDLDSSLALIYGNAVLLEGEAERAHEPLRQAIRLEAGTQRPLPRVALGIAYASAGDHASASELFRRAAELDSDDPMAVSLWLDSLRRESGEAAALEQARAWAESRPDNTAAHLAWVQAAQAAGDAGQSAAAAEAAGAVFEAQVLRQPGDAALQATYARFLVSQGKLDSAQAAADKATELDPGLGLAWIAQADVASAKGDEAAAAGHLERAGGVASSHPAYALLLAD